MTPIDYNDPNEMWRHNNYDPYNGMSDEERINAGCMQVVTFIVMLIVGLALCALFGSCTTTKYVPVIEHHTDTLYQNIVQRDSIVLKDSIHVSENGDTVRIERWHTKFIKKEVHDTIYISKTDSIPTPYPVEVKVPAELSCWQSFRMTFGTIMLIAMVIVVGVWIVKKKLHIH